MPNNDRIPKGMTPQELAEWNFERALQEQAENEDPSAFKEERRIKR
ncbi:MAG: hypothetical protein IJ549_03330 [Prevotella sp.]|nr:hypothetical protein [Prevotella sp.]